MIAMINKLLLLTMIILSTAIVETVSFTLLLEFFLYRFAYIMLKRLNYFMPVMGKIKKEKRMLFNFRLLCKLVVSFASSKCLQHNLQSSGFKLLRQSYSNPY